MKLFNRITAALLFMGICAPSGSGYASTIVHREQSLYSNIVVKRVGSLTCMQFSIKRDLRNQSCIHNKRPKQMVFAYTKMSMTSLLLTPEPQRIAIIGLGGGTLPMAFADLLPNAAIDTVEIDPAVVELAGVYFGFSASDRIRVFTQDARVWTKRAQRRGERYDLVILDAFNGEYIPEHLMTREYLAETKGILSERGTLVANTFAISDLYDHESATYADVFGDIASFQVPESANRVIVYSRNKVDDDELMVRAEALRAALKPYDVPIKRYARQFAKQRRAKPDWDVTARILTDQYNPANLLQGR